MHAAPTSFCASADLELERGFLRTSWYVAAYLKIGNAFRELIGSFDAAMTAVEVAALIEYWAKVKIEVSAVIPD